MNVILGWILKALERDENKRHMNLIILYAFYKECGINVDVVVNSLVLAAFGFFFF